MVILAAHFKVGKGDFRKMVEQVLRIAALALLGSRNPVADYQLLQRRRQQQHTSIVPPPSQPRQERPPQQVQQVTSSSAGIGRTFEDRVIHEMLPLLAAHLTVTPPRRLFRVMRETPHCGDLAIHYQNCVGLVELKNHNRAVPLVDRRRFFDNILINQNFIDWALLITSRSSVPKFAEKGYVIVGRLVINESKYVPLGFVCGLDNLGLPALETAVRELTDRALINKHSAPFPPYYPSWNVNDLLVIGEITEVHSSLWAATEGNRFMHPPGTIFS